MPNNTQTLAKIAELQARVMAAHAHALGFDADSRGETRDGQCSCAREMLVYADRLERIADDAE